jgi:hypothetical protein
VGVVGAADGVGVAVGVDGMSVNVNAAEMFVFNGFIGQSALSVVI